jgi:hypothetical protein
VGGFAPFARIVGMCKDNQQDKEDQEFLDLAWEVSQLRKELELVQSFHNVAVFDSYQKAQHFGEDYTTDESWRVSHDIEEWEVM